MKAQGFIAESSTKIAEFIGNYFNTHLTQFSLNVMTELPESMKPEEVSGSRSGFWARLGGKTEINVLLLPYEIEKTAHSRAQYVHSHNIEVEGETKSFKIRADEAYRIKFAVCGPTLATRLGQDLTSAFVAFFFDHKAIEFQMGDKLEIIRFSDTIQQWDEHANERLMDLGVSSKPIFLFFAEVSISTGTVVSYDSLVKEKSINVNQRSMEVRSHA